MRGSEDNISSSVPGKGVTRRRVLRGIAVGSIAATGGCAGLKSVVSRNDIVITGVSGSATASDVTVQIEARNTGDTTKQAVFEIVVTGDSLGRGSTEQTFTKYLAAKVPPGETVTVEEPIQGVLSGQRSQYDIDASVEKSFDPDSLNGFKKRVKENSEIGVTANVWHDGLSYFNLEAEGDDRLDCVAVTDARVSEVFEFAVQGSVRRVELEVKYDDDAMSDKSTLDDLVPMQFVDYTREYRPLQEYSVDEDAEVVRITQFLQGEQTVVVLDQRRWNELQDRVREVNKPNMNVPTICTAYDN